MSVIFSILQGSAAIAGPATGTVAHFGTSVGGTAVDRDVNQHEPGSDALVPAILGYGDMPEPLERKLRISGARQLSVKVHASIAATISAVTHAGSGPAVTAAAGAGGIVGTFPLLRAKVVTAGVNGSAKIQVAYDGFTYGGNLDVPALLPATIVGIVDLSLITASSLDTLTLIATTDLATLHTCTFAGTTFANIVTQINAAIPGVTASIVAGRFLKIVANTTLGTPSTLDLGAGTANVILGFVADPALVTGTNSTVALGPTGAVYTFPSGTYALGDTYTVATVGPRMALADFVAAAASLRASGLPFELVEICQDPLDGTDALAWAAQVESTISSWENDNENRIFPSAILGTSLGAAGSFTSNDNDVRTSFAGTSSLRQIIAHGDDYVTGSEFAGTHRRSLRTTVSEILSRDRASQDPGFGGLSSDAAFPQAFAVSPDKVTQARNEALATVLMSDANFAVMVVQNQAPKIKRGRTRAPSGSKLGFVGIMRAARLAATVAYQILLRYENADFDLLPSGRIRPVDAASAEGVFDQGFREFILSPGHASACFATIDQSKVADSQGKYPLTVIFTLQVKGQSPIVTGILSLVTQLQIVAAA